MADDLIEEQVNPALETKLPRYNYGIVLECDFVNDKKKQEIVDVACIACEKHSPMEKSRKGDNFATFVKWTLTKQLIVKS